MKVISPDYEILFAPDGVQMLKNIERCGRVCYKSEDRITGDSAGKFIRMILASGHESVLEHEKISVRVVCDRGVTHEIVRHRMASYSQESTRYCNYSKDKFGAELTFIKPCYFEEGSEKYRLWTEAMEQAEKAYFALLDAGARPEEARGVLPNALKTELVMTMNIREWRHFFKLRCSQRAHPQMRELAGMILNAFKLQFPVVFDDIEPVERHISVAIDGPAGAGKSTVAKAAAKLLGCHYVDTGAVYRTLAWYCTENGIDTEDEAALAKAFASLDIKIRFEDGVQKVFANGTDPGDKIRTPKVSALTSKIAAKPVVRDFLLEIQRRTAVTADVIMDGRDIGTVVLPNADVKIYLTASPEIRAKRRYDELIAKGAAAEYEDILKAVNDRDRQDMTRAVAPLKQADDAVLIDCGEMTIDEAVNAVVSTVGSKTEGR